MPCVSRLKAIRFIRALLLATVIVALAGTTTPAAAQDLVYDFPSNTGDVVWPGGALAQGRDGNLYGTSAAVFDIPSYGGIYRLTPAGSEAGLHAFAIDGSEGTYCGTWPAAWGMTLGRDGKFYGTCQGGGNAANFCGGDYGCGTVYSITPDGTFAVLHSFLGGTAEGADPVGPLTQGADGNFYGTTSLGGANNSGTVYKITPTGTLTTIHSFANDSAGFSPSGSLFLSSDGNFYGTTSGAGTGGYGAVYKMSTKGKITVLHNFAAGATDGASPFGVVQGADGSFYGATFSGGTSNEGTLFKVTTGKKFTLLHSFDLAADYGIYPGQPVVQATDGNLYGVATSYAGGGYANNGSLYQMGTTKKGKFSVVFEFGPGHGGIVPIPDSPLLIHTNGIMYGSTYQGGQNSTGVVYSLTAGLEPFVVVQTKLGKVGTSVNILGQGFAGATDVSFNGTSAAFSVVSDTFMTATIPTGATTGFVTVTTVGGTLKSSAKFKVKP